jgi:hypothetical protein
LHPALAEILCDLIMAQRLADHEESILQPDGQYPGASKIEGIVAQTASLRQHGGWGIGLPNVSVSMQLY